MVARPSFLGRSGSGKFQVVVMQSSQCYQSIAQRPLDVIKELRKELFKKGICSKEYEILPKLGKGMIDYGNPFFQSNEKRENFGREMGAKKATSDTKTLFFVGCSATFDATSHFIAQAMASIMNKAGEEWGILGKEELCCGIPLLDVEMKMNLLRWQKRASRA